MVSAAKHWSVFLQKGWRVGGGGPIAPGDLSVSMDDPRLRSESRRRVKTDPDPQRLLQSHQSSSRKRSFSVHKRTRGALIGPQSISSADVSSCELHMPLGVFELQQGGGIRGFYGPQRPFGKHLRHVNAALDRSTST